MYFYRLICALLALLTWLRVRAVVRARRQARAEVRLQAMARHRSPVDQRECAAIRIQVEDPLLFRLEESLLGASYRGARKYLA